MEIGSVKEVTEDGEGKCDALDDSGNVVGGVLVADRRGSVWAGVFISEVGDTVEGLNWIELEIEGHTRADDEVAEAAVGKEDSG